MAIAETIHEYHNQAGLWPRGDRVRPVARALAAEMHAGFQALRSACPMNMRRHYAGFRPDDGVGADLQRLARLWSHARLRRTGEGPYLFGSFSAVDAFFAPVASRVATYDLEMDADSSAYVAALLVHPSVRRWRAMAVADPFLQAHYELDLPTRPAPHPPDVVGTPVSGREAINAACPFSGADAAPGLQVEVADRVLGFASEFDRDKVAADPLVWPEVAALLD